jgi:DNA ligase (NAD+)
MNIKNATPENIAKLAKLLTDARQAYYNKTPTLSDAEYDRLEDVLRTINPNHPFFQTIGAPVEEVSGWAKSKHTIPMMSLNKAQTSDELKAWWDKYVAGQRVPEVLVTSKLDGISVALRYDKGVLVKAVTRGDGETGEDITRNVKLMKVPQKIKTKDPVDVRGEIICRRSILAQYFPGESNCRNTASGTAKRQSNPEACKHLDILAYRFIPSKGAKYALRSDELHVLESEGFQTPLMNVIPALADVETLYQDYIKTIRASLDYDIDGLVVEINSRVTQDNLGELNHRPTGAIAFKFPPDTAESILRDIIWQVGNTGRITPVAVFDEVTLAGAKVTRASLAGVKQVKRMKLYPGCTINVARRNDCIPRVEANISLGIKNTP